MERVEISMPEELYEYLKDYLADLAGTVQDTEKSYTLDCILGYVSGDDKLYQSWIDEIRAKIELEWTDQELVGRMKLDPETWDYDLDDTMTFGELAIALQWIFDGIDDLVRWLHSQDLIPSEQLLVWVDLPRD